MVTGQSVKEFQGGPPSRKGRSFGWAGHPCGYCDCFSRSQAEHRYRLRRSAFSSTGISRPTKKCRFSLFPVMMQGKRMKVKRKRIAFSDHVYAAGDVASCNKDLVRPVVGLHASGSDRRDQCGRREGGLSDGDQPVCAWHHGDQGRGGRQRERAAGRGCRTSFKIPILRHIPTSSLFFKRIS